MADPRALGALLRAARERAGFTQRAAATELARAWCAIHRTAFDDACASSALYRLGSGEHEDGARSLLDGPDIAVLAALYGLDAASADALHVAARTTPPDVAALAADPARWATLRASDATARVVAAARAWDAAEAAWRAGTGTGGLGAVLHAADALRDGLRALDGTAPSADPGTPTLADVPTSILRRIEWHLRPNAPGDSPPRTAEDARWSFVALLNHAGMRIYWPEAGPWRDVRLADVRAELDLRALDARDGAT